MADLSEAAEQFAELAKNLILVGEDGLRRELYKAIEEAARPFEPAVRRGLPDHLPDRYAEVLDADLAIRTSRRSAGSDPGVHIEAQSRAHARKIRRLNAPGLLTHPVYGNREVWRTQGPEGGGMSAGFFDDPVQKLAPRVREQVVAAVERAEDQALGRRPR